jgi:Heme/copper-type cytochrome/quinol oxidases, subunit 1
MKTNLVRGLNEKAGNNFSWRAVLAGLVTFLATLILLSFIGTAIGFGTPDLTASDPFSGVGTGLVIWVIVTLILSFGAGGYIAGLTANRAGFIHGFITWAVSLISIVVLMASGISSAFGALGNVVGATVGAVGDVTQQVGSGVATLTEESFNAITENMNVDTAELESTTTEVLEDTDIPELQPDYLQSQLDATGEEIANAGYNIVVGGNDAGSEIDNVVSNIEERVDTINQGLDTDALTTAVSNNTDLSEEEAEAAVNNINETYTETAEQASQALDDAKVAVQDLQTEAEQAIEEGRQTAEEVSNNAAKYSLYIFVGLLIAMFVTAFAGQAGAKTYLEAHEDNTAIK